MRILYIHQHFCTPRGSGGTRSYEFARRWVRQGHSVRVLCGTGYDETLPANEEIDVEGIRVCTVDVPYDHRMGFARRLWSFLKFSLRAVFHAARSRDVDVVLATSTPLTVALPALAARWIAQRPMVFEVRDVWPDAAVDAGVLRNPVFIWMARMLESLTYQSADRIVALSTGMRDRILRKGRYDAKMTVIPNCSDVARFGPHVDAGELRSRFDAEDKFIILYAGAIGLANHMEYLADAIALLRDEADMEWWFVGGGNRLEYLKEQVERRGARNVRFLGSQPKGKVPSFAAAADVGLVTFIPAPVYFENSPNKFFDYAAAGLPVLFNRSTWLEPTLRRYNAGFCCDPARPGDMADTLRRLRDDRALREEMGRGARRMAETEFAVDLMAERYLTLLEGVVASSGAGAAAYTAKLEGDGCRS